MVMDFLVKRAKYSRWKVGSAAKCHVPCVKTTCCPQASPGSGYNSPAHCHTHQAEGVYHSLSTISEYIPLVSHSEAPDLQVKVQYCRYIICILKSTIHGSELFILNCFFL
jgi:hypothetical protein